MQTHTLIVGGGLAGLGAAVALAERGVRVTVLESRPRLGGRASSFVDRTTGTAIDNCQHVSMGCCTNFTHFCRTIGIDGFFRRERELYFIGPDKVINRFSGSRLPAPLHLLPAFRRLSYLERSDLRALGRGIKALMREPKGRNVAAEAMPFSRWLARHSQPASVVERVWQVVLVSALSESLDRIDVRHARKVFADAFLGNRQGWEVQVPTVPLDELYGMRLTDWLTQRGGEIRLQAGAERLVMEGERVAAVELRSGERITADQFILAVPHDLVGGLLPEPVCAHPSLAGLARLEAAPISSVHLWFDRPVTPLPHAVFVERLSQWMFNRTLLQSSNVRRGAPDPAPFRRGSPDPAETADRRSPERSGRPAVGGVARSGDRATVTSGDATDDQGQYLQVVISASRNLAGRSQEETIEEVVGELSAVWPEAGRAALRHARVVTEHRAVFSPLPGVEELRPAQQSPVLNLQLAGDYTRTGWPATMEGAVRSGYGAAENVLRHVGRPERVVQAELPVSWLARVLLGV